MATVVGAAVSWLAGVFASWGASASVATFLAEVVVAVALVAGSNALASSMARSGFDGKLDPQQFTKLQSNPLSDRLIVYGETGIAGEIDYQGVRADREWIDFVIALADNGQSQPHELIKVLINGDEVTFDEHGAAIGEYAGVMTLRFHGGTPDQTADSALISASSGIWTSDHRGRGVCYVVWSCKLSDGRKFPMGRPDPIFVIRGRRLYDRRKDDTVDGGEGDHRVDDDSTWEWSDNAALAADDWARGVFMGDTPRRVAGYGLPERLIDASWVMASANVCDDRGWTINGPVIASSDPDDVRKHFAEHMCGRIATRRGKYAIIAGNDWPSVLTITESDLAGPLKIKHAREWRETFNAGKGAYRDATTNYEGVKTNLVSVSDWVEQDGQEFIKPFTFLYTHDQANATRLTKFWLYRQRAPRRIEAAIKLRKGRALEGDIVDVVLPSHGINEAYEVVTWSLDQSGFVNVTLDLWDEAGLEWSEGEEGDPPEWARLTRVPMTPPTPEITDWSVDAALNVAGGIPALLVAGNSPEWIDAVVVDYRLDGDSVWINAGSLNAGGDALFINLVAPDEDYEVSIRYRYGALYSDRLVIDEASPDTSLFGKITTFYQTSTPTAEGVGDLWHDSDDAQRRTYRWSGSAWVEITDRTAFNTAAAIAGQGDLATTNAAQLPFGANCIVNSGFEAGVTHWTAYTETNTGLTNVSGRNLDLGGSNQYFGARNVGYTRQVGTPSAAGTYFVGLGMPGWNGGLTNLRRYALPVVTGNRVFVGARVAQFNLSEVRIWARWFDKDGALVLQDTLVWGVGDVPDGTAGVYTALQGDPTKMVSIGWFVTAPAGACFCNIAFGGVVDGDANPGIFLTDVMLSLVQPGQTAHPPYVPGPTDRRADATIENTAAAIQGQGWGATASEANASNAYVNTPGANAARYSMLEDGLTGWRIHNNSYGGGAVATRKTSSPCTVQRPGLNFNNAAGTNGQDYYGTLGQDVSNATFLLPVKSGERVQIAARILEFTGSCTGVFLRALQINTSGVNQGDLSPDGANNASPTTAGRTWAFFVASMDGFIGFHLYARKENATTAAGGFTIDEMFVSKARAGQIAIDPYTPGQSSEAGADITSNNTAAAVSGQGPLTTVTPPSYAGNTAAYTALGAGQLYTDTSDSNKVKTSYAPASAFVVSLSALSDAKTATPSVTNLVSISVTATASGGSGSYSYRWQQLNAGVVAGSANSPDSATTTFNATPPNSSTATALFECTAVDLGTGAVAKAVFQFQVTHEP